MRTLWMDVDTQIDSLFPAGALYVPGGERVVPAVAALNARAASLGQMLISIVDVHTENDPEFLHWPSHCVKGTVGQQKPGSTLVAGHVTVPNKHSGELPLSAPQIILEKPKLDPFSNPRLTSILESYQPERCIVYGVVTEICAELAVEGLHRHCSRIEVVTDAIRALDESKALASLRRWESDGVLLVTAASLLQ